MSMKVKFIGDPFRWHRDDAGCLRPSSFENVLWLYYNLHRALVSAGFEPPNMTDVRTEVDGFFASYQRLLAIPPDAGPVALGEVWTRNYEQSSATGPLADCLGDQDVMVIGFEIPPSLKKFLVRCAIPYVSVRIGSHRFMRDLSLSMTSNHEKVGILLRQFMLGRDEIAAQVDYARATYVKKSRELPFPVTDSLFFIGQLPSDASLITGGIFARAWHFDDQCRTLAKQFPVLIYLQHPNMPSDGLELAYFRSIFSRVLEVTDAGYAAIFTLESMQFLTLSSSLGVEAISSGHTCDFLVQHPETIGYCPRGDVRKYLELGHDAIGVNLWKQVLSAVKPAWHRHLPAVFLSGRSRWAQSRGVFAEGPNYLRNSLESWAGKALAYGGPLPVVGVGAYEPIASINHPSSCIPTTDERTGEVQAICEFGLQGGEQLAPLLHSGWHHFAQWGVWAHQEAVLAIDSRWMIGAKIEITLQGRVFVNSSVPNQGLTIYIDGAMHSFSLVNEVNAAADIKMIIEKISSPITVITICVSDVISPQKLGVSDDERCLGYGLRALIFRKINDSNPGLNMVW